ncbi:endonuclease/exonuclease/phosphatase family protein [Candidatus Palibaumannia cicadellinicola]|uniref:Endonuclease/exonuclease/phosphatase domain-containing protein n=1 Tax=Candidatus Palibaumannia cicadellinicola TaxID=186490 RepID=A0A0K2BLE1_9GAMM|nr:endonuclease/exonuclease/phosphatase family protein [Candidatus Baumannia cicadellinicola]AKZ66012.1 hypothetical protein AB162_424 [Candidatus Baumannia cicadellinicola]
MHNVPPILYDNQQTLSKLEVPLLGSHILRVMVWNIFKQQRANWLSILHKFKNKTQLVLLQEAQTTPELMKFATSNYLSADKVPAIIFPQYSSGVMTLSTAYPVYCYPLREREPLLRIDKSALITIYPIYDKQSIMVINIHAVNFCVGINVYSKQLGPIGEHIIKHTGPVIMAGDFNAWSRKRMLALYKFAETMRLQEVNFINDQRTKVFGRPLDFIFYRNIKVNEASVLVTKASDHNPLLVAFQK